MTQHGSTLFGHLATHFSIGTENLASEALNYVLQRSFIARQAFLEYLSSTVTTSYDELSFQTQVTGDDQAIPDLVGLDESGRPVVIIEAKFWAGLTPNQPVTYIHRLPRDVPSVLLFVAPGLRMETIWPELQKRSALAGYELSKNESSGAEFVFTRLNESQTLALVSWRALLNYIQQALENAGEGEHASDIAQLQGLCRRMDNQAFLPLQSEELTGNFGNRVIQLCELIDDVTRRAVDEGIVKSRSSSGASGKGYYARKMRFEGCQGVLSFHAMRWGRLRPTPLWLSLTDSQGAWRVEENIKARLSALARQNPSKLLTDDGHLTIPIDLPLGVERSEVVGAILEQLRKVASLLGN